jgi:hypothetical protein
MKVNNALICLDCDTIYVEDGECPTCLSRSSYPLRKWLEPLKPFGGKRNEINNNKIQMESEKESIGSIDVRDVDHISIEINGGGGQGTPSSQQSRFAPNYNPEPPESKISKSNNISGERVESKSYFIKWRNWLDAGYATIWEGICRVFQDGVILPRKEYHSRY